MGKNRFMQLIIGIILFLAFVFSTFIIIKFMSYEDERYYEQLDGEWDFIEQQLITSSQFANTHIANQIKQVQLPASFQTHTGKVSNFGTYQKVINIPEELIGSTLAIKIPYQYGAYTLSVDGQEILSAGEVGTKALEHETVMVPKIGYFIPMDSQLVMTIQASSFDHIRGGLENSMTIGEASMVTEKHTRTAILILFINGCIFMMGVFMVLFAWYNKREFLFLLFGTFTILISIRSLFTDPFYYIYLFPSMSWLSATRLEYILSIAVSALYLVLLWKWHEQYFSKKLMIGSVGVAVVVLLLTLFSQPVFFQALFFKVFVITIPIFIYLIYVVYKSIKAKIPIVKVNLFGMILIFLAFFNDFAVGNNWYQGQPLMLLAVTIYVTIHAFLMSKEYASKKIQTERLNVELQILNDELDQRVQERTEQLEEVNHKLAAIALNDSLTGIHNRHSFNEYLVSIFQFSQVRQEPLSLIMLDIDEFKAYNDTYGHVEGDVILQQVVEIIDNSLPENSFFARYGGEEFAILLPNTIKECAISIAEQAREVIANERLVSKNSKLGYITISLGVATMDQFQKVQSEIAFVELADQKLYEAKQTGRNRVAS